MYQGFKKDLHLATYTHQHQQAPKTRDSLCKSLLFVAKDKLEHPLLKIHDRNPVTSVRMLLQWRQGPTGWRISEGGKLCRNDDDRTRSRSDWATAYRCVESWKVEMLLSKNLLTLNFGLSTDKGCKICCFDSWDTLAETETLVRRIGCNEQIKRTCDPSIATISRILWHNCMVSTDPPHIYSEWRYSTFRLESQIPDLQLSAEISQFWWLRVRLAPRDWLQSSENSRDRCRLMDLKLMNLGLKW